MEMYRTIYKPLYLTSHSHNSAVSMPCSSTAQLKIAADGWLDILEVGKRKGISLVSMLKQEVKGIDWDLILIGA